ncbi:hypothetical protein E2C01_060266 [Portunus trituberculatus]|uniref:Uncharacterized protein n=1 Tax=Portunus trituberculatus TaxID=210409 RepID=A0A5B7H0H7_PORTR|nr:hypothetical protein [Portunus trituberculatus]
MTILPSGVCLMDD